MTFLFNHMLSLILLVPLVGALVVLCIPGRCRIEIRITSLAVALVTLILAALMYASLEPLAEFQLREAAAWIPSLGIAYRVGVDGVSAMMVLLTAILSLVAIAAAWVEIDRAVKAFHILVLSLQTGLMGTFMAMDAFLFYVLWEAVLIPMCFIIGVWGSGNKMRSAIKFMIFMTTGSLVMLVAMLYCANTVGSFDLVAWYGHEFGARAQLILFPAFAFAFAVKLPVIPFHTWLPDAHTDAPTAGSVLLAGVLLKMGAYGFYRFAMPLFPLATAAYAPYLLVPAVAAIIYAGLVALAQDDMKRLIAYSSIAHMGFILLGLFSLEHDAVLGAALQMFNHGITTGGLFIMTGLIYERTHTRMIADYGGAARPMPLLAAFFIFFAVASAGLPGLSTFVGEFLVLMGSFQTRTWFALPALAGAVIAAAYMLWLIQRVFFGPRHGASDHALDDLTVREHLMTAPLLALIVAIGVYPQPWLKNMDVSVDAFLKLATRGVAVMPRPAPLERSNASLPSLEIPEAGQPHLYVDEPSPDSKETVETDVDDYEGTAPPKEKAEALDSSVEGMPTTPETRTLDTGRYEIRVHTRTMPPSAPPPAGEGSFRYQASPPGTTQGTQPRSGRVTLPPLPPELEDE